MTAEIGVIGLGTMGRNLALNIADRNIPVIGWNRGEDLVLKVRAESPQLPATTNLAEFVASLRQPRAMLLLVPAGGPVDGMIDQLLQLLSPGDVIVDAGNSFFSDTDRRVIRCREHEIRFMGMGVSGGEEGARHGPSLMAGGDREAYERVEPTLMVIAARTEDGTPCAAWMGKGSAGHYVKMVHNGIEYGLMQLIAEAYDWMRTAGDLTNAECADQFGTWARSEFGGYLLEISETVLRYRDEETGESLVDLIVDGAKQKGTGKWTSQNAMDLGSPVPTIDAAVSARYLSGMRQQRHQISKRLGTLSPAADVRADRLGEALHAAFVLTYAQGLAQLAQASEEFDYEIQLESVAKVWRAGCIVRSRLLGPIAEASSQQPGLQNLLLDRSFAEGIAHRAGALRGTVADMAQHRIPMPAFSASLAYLDSLSRERLPANMIQALRDCFGAHGFERTDREGTFHAEWEGRG